VAWSDRDGTPTPLGVAWIEAEGAYNFALYSRHATAVTLLLFSPHDPERPVLERPLCFPGNKSGRVWHCRLPESVVGEARHYAYRVDGPNDVPGNRFDADKVLLDPYARGVYFPPAFDRLAATHSGSSYGNAPLGVLPERTGDGLRPFDWGDDRPPRHESDAVIYELHVRGFTMRDPSIPAEHRGTFAGVVDKIPYLRALGITVVELMPVFQWDPEEENYWGYMPLNFFSPHQNFSTAGTPDAAFDEFRAMVKALHAAGIEVVLDVVYNHTGEGGSGGPTYSYRGIDNGTYYLLDAEMSGYRNDTGTGNVLRCQHPAVRQLIADSLRFWVREMHVDGFRFDLASIFTRDANGELNLSHPALIDTIGSDPTLSGARLIAEAWDLCTYELGRAFPGTTWGQWNGRFRDDVRDFVRGLPGVVGPLMTRMYGSDDLFPDTIGDAYRPHQSVNFITCHDGFTLHDLVSYDRKHNEANGNNDTDGSDDNRSWNCGWEGEAGAPDSVRALRVRQAKNLLTLLLLANGTPMLRAGDEFLHTQGGNNNAYNQDNSISWLDWSRVGQFTEVAEFLRRMIAFRAAHPGIAPGRFWRDDVRWHGADPDHPPYQESQTLAFSLCGTNEDGQLYIMINGSPNEVRFAIQDGAPGEWRRVVDTWLPPPDDFRNGGGGPPLQKLEYMVAGRSVVVLRRDESTA
jgi:glycogen operon protein